MALLIQSIPPLQTPYGLIDRDIHVIGLNIVDTTKELFLPYQIIYTYNGEDVSKDFKPFAKPIYIHNNMTVYQRNLEDFSKKSNPDFVEGESPEEERYLVAPAYDYIIGVMKEYPELSWAFIRGYIVENYEDGFYENLNPDNFNG